MSTLKETPAVNASRLEDATHVSYLYGTPYFYQKAGEDLYIWEPGSSTRASRWRKLEGDNAYMSSNARLIEPTKDL